MKVLRFSCFQYLIHLVLSNNVLQCGSQSFQSQKRYFVIKNDSCFIPQSLTSKLINSTPQKLYGGQKGRFALFNIYSGSQVDPYSFYISGESKIQPSLSGGNGKGSELNNFRSPVLDEWKTFKPLFMEVSIEDYSDKIVARLVFKVNEGDTVESWFNKSNMIESFPWNIDILRNYNYNYFTITDVQHPTRKFYINLLHNGCNLDIGILSIYTTNEPCLYGQKWSNSTNYVYPQILYINDNGKAGKWTIASAGKALKIVGLYDASITIYI